MVSAECAHPLELCTLIETFSSYQIQVYIPSVGPSLWDQGICVCDTSKAFVLKGIPSSHSSFKSMKPHGISEAVFVTAILKNCLSALGS